MSEESLKNDTDPTTLKLIYFIESKTIEGKNFPVVRFTFHYQNVPLGQRIPSSPDKSKLNTLHLDLLPRNLAKLQEMMSQIMTDFDPNHQ